jgi:hypothetical protein
MPNATQVRLSRAGLDFIEANAVSLLGGVLAGVDTSMLPVAITTNNGVISVPLGNSLLEGADLPVAITLCPANNCTLDVSIPSLELTPIDGGAGPDRLRIDVQIDLASNRSTPVTILGQSCSFNFQTDETTPNTINARVEAVFAEDGNGYGTGQTPSLVVDLATLQGVDLNLSCGGLVTFGYFLIDSNDPDSWDSGGSDNMANDIFAEVKTTLNQAMGELMTKLFTFCAVPQGGVCATGNNVDGICMANATTCVPMTIGVQTQLDASGLLGNIFPGSTFIMDVLFAMQGEAHAVSSGYNLNFFGGFENAAAPAACVSGITLDNPPTRPTDIPLADAIQNSEEAHVVVGVAERMMDWGAYLRLSTTYQAENPDGLRGV